MERKKRAAESDDENRVNDVDRQRRKGKGYQGGL